MAYTPTTWVDNAAPDIDAANLNHLEQGVQAAAATADAAVPSPASPVSNDAMVWNGSAWTHAKIADANVSATAQIAYGKLTLTGSVVDADIASGANLHKLAAVTGTPNGTKFLRDDGSWQAASSTTYRKTTAKTVNTTVAETDLLNGEITVAAGAMGTTGIARLTAFGDWLQNAGSFTVPRFKLKLGATTVFDTGASVTARGASASRMPWWIVAEISNLGAANSQAASISGMIMDNASGTPTNFTTGEGNYTESGGGQVPIIGYNTAAVDTSSAQALVLSVILPTSSASCEIVLKSALIEVL